MELLQKHQLISIVSISKRTEISRLKKDGSLWIGLSIKIIFEYNKGFDHRLAVLVSRRHGIAVYRNYIKRIIRESVRMALKKDSANKDLIVLPKVRAQKLQYNEVCRDIAQWKCSLKESS